MRQYSAGKLIARPSVAEDRAALLRDLHPLDREELNAAGATDTSIPRGSIAVQYGGRLVCLAGRGMVEGYSVPWMLCTTVIDEVPKVAMARLSRDVVRHWIADIEANGPMVNMVYSRNRRAVAFLQWLGFDVQTDRPAGPGGQFYVFTMGVGGGACAASSWG